MGIRIAAGLGCTMKVLLVGESNRRSCAFSRTKVLQELEYTHFESCVHASVQHCGGTSGSGAWKDPSRGMPHTGTSPHPPPPQVAYGCHKRRDPPFYASKAANAP